MCMINGMGQFHAHIFCLLFFQCPSVSSVFALIFLVFQVMDHIGV